jgi:hypothetical protein
VNDVLQAIIDQEQRLWMSGLLLGAFLDIPGYFGQTVQSSMAA